MMKRIFSCFFVVLSLIMLNAQQEEVNSFQQSENRATGTTNGSAVAASQVQSGPGNPPGDDEIPIDDYLPALAVVAASLILYQIKSRKVKTV